MALIHKATFLPRFIRQFLYLFFNRIVFWSAGVQYGKNIKGSIFVNTNAKLLIGNNVGMSSPCIWCDNNIVIGNNVKLGGLVTLLDTDCHSLDYLNRRNTIKDVQNTKTSPVIIEDDVLIGANSIVLKGVRIGARTIVGAGSIVSSNLPPDCIAAGNPCKVIRDLK